MKRKVYIILAALLGIGNMSEAVAQDTKNILPGVSIEKFHMNREGKYLTMEMEVDLTALDVDANRAVLLTPRLVNGADSLDLPAIGIYGRRRYYYYVRNGISAISGESEKSFQVRKNRNNWNMTTISFTKNGWMEPPSSSTAATGVAASKYWRNTKAS